jgi:hypothetical protein
VISFYQYVAINSPAESVSILNKYGYQVPASAGPDQIASALEELVSADGATPLYDILSYHPDKDIILEVYGKQDSASAPEKKCNCGGHEKSAVESYVQAASGNAGLHLQQGNIFLIGAVLMLTVAIVVSSNNK